ncbi:uncharacterized protein BT62DRAFT_921180 [Guyanagaster necrorhizus]|uniref:Uncharacterized protein n=1 Tax=Guyanagaster necrorhizus TaxID=856835 RepID=A0A9P8AQP9_9AGAR|nr:uncharacterized protein BT62DRAFT_921180 [Guyanagaster necrorhizus MCA 3950]KAG7444349.1 hypothetical protein BT62DRAFT_921180 [Guyanagaster necrorhizus MCA 3950]
MAVLGQPLFLTLDILFFLGSERWIIMLCSIKARNLRLSSKGCDMRVRQMFADLVLVLVQSSTMPMPSLDSSSQADKLIHVKGGAKCIRVLHIVLKNEYKGSAVTCLAPYVLALESWVTKTLHANARTKIKKEGIVEILNLTDTLLFSIMIDLLVLPPLAEYFTNLTLLDDLVTSMINEDEDETSACTNVGSSSAEVAERMKIHKEEHLRTRPWEEDRSLKRCVFALMVKYLPE